MNITSGREKASINKVTDLSAKYNCAFVEFDLITSREFNQKLEVIIYNMICRRIAVDQNIRTGNDFLNHARKWHESLFQETRAAANRRNFLFTPCKELEDLRRTISLSVEHYIQLSGYNYNGNIPNCLHSWPLIYYKHLNDLSPHMHHVNPMNICGVYYVSGNFDKNCGELQIMTNKVKDGSFVSYVPKPGKLILFPATVPHSLGDYSGKCFRTSIAFDLWFKPDPARDFRPLR